MKILAIRGANLASLEGSFALELAEGPLAAAGVFAICGPTGAGKTTLLDAMCLALFDTAPRLDASRRVRVGSDQDEDRLTTRDPRSILRKGAGRGHAEVDFEGVDRRRYRARWEVRRARERADGKMQASAMSLVELDTEERFGARKTDVKAEIETRLGLSFDQFRRSVLLAQGDFAAFLDADPRERADLLERMTGTAIYGVISQEAHARASEEARRLDVTAERLRAVPELSEAEREELERRREALSIRAREDELAALNADRALRWHHELEALKREEAAARAERQRILGQLALAETKRHELSAYEAAVPLRPHLDGVVAAERLVERRVEERAEAASAAERARAAVASAAAVAAASSAALEGASTDRDRVRVVAEQARALDRAVDQQRKRLEGLSGELARADRERAAAERALDALQREEAGAAQDAARARQWLSAHPEARALEEDWSRAEDHLDRVVAHSEQLGPLRESRASARRRQRAAVAEEARRDGTWRGLAVRLAEARTDHARVRDEADAAPSAAIATETHQWVARRTALEALIGVAERAQQASEARARHLARARQAAESARAASSRAAEAEAGRERSGAKLEEALAHRDRIRATLDLADHRADLVDGEPCPLCGSAEHPYADEVPAVNALRDAADARASELRAEVSRLDASIAEAHKEAQSERADAARAGAEAEAWTARLTEARDAYRRAARALDGPWPDELPEAPAEAADDKADWGPLFALVSPGEPGDAGVMLSPEAYAALQDAREQAIEALARLGREERVRRERESEAERLRAELETARDAEVVAREALSVARNAAAAAAERLDRVAEALARVEADRARSVESLAGALAGFGDWRRRLLDDAAGFSGELRDAVSARRTWLELARRAESSQLARGPALEGARVELRQASAAAERAREAHVAAAEELARAQAERRALLGGATADEAEERASRALEAARAELERAQAALRQAHRDDAEAAARAERAEVARIEAEVARRELDDALRSALEDAGLDREAACARLARDPAEVDAFRAELRRLDEQRAEQTAVLSERERKRARHEEDQPPAIGMDEAAEALSAARQRASETRELLVAVRSRLENDARHRSEAAALRLAMADQLDRLEVWTMLNDLVGSANGNKLRVFAQSLTLELLLEHANHHLRDLSPRYGLARVPGEDLALQVIDHEMGDEVRAVTSLSGGESFLVALGLALGLASLSSQQARVGSLFIDEGFGALDPASLELVLSTLDVLQASGRQVGLISHVPAVAERFDTRVQVVAAGPARSRVELIDRAHQL